MASTASVNIIKQGICKIQPISLLARQFSSTITVFNQQVQSSTTEKINSDVPGLSSACVGSEEPVGPGAAKDAEYKVPEYFNFNQYSYFEAEIELQKYRCPQPSAVTKGK